MAKKKVCINWELLRGAMYRKQSEVAEKLGVSQPALSNKLSGRRSLTLDNLNDIATALDRDTMDFLIEKST